MNFISLMFFQDQFQIISLLAQPLCFSFCRSISVILVVFLVAIWRSKKSFSSKSCPFFRSFVVLVSCYPIKLFQVMQILFIHPEHFRSFFLSRSSGGHLFGRFLRSKFSDSFSNYSISVPLRSSQLSRCFVQIFVNQLEFFSFFCI